LSNSGHTGTFIALAEGIDGDSEHMIGVNAARAFPIAV